MSGLRDYLIECECALPGQVPHAGVDDDHVRLQAILEICQDALHVAGVDAGQEIEADQVVVRAELADLSVPCSVVHGNQLPPFHQVVLLKVHLSLKNQKQ